MIQITKLAASVLIQKDAAEIVIDDRAIRATLGAIIRELIDCGRATAEARREGYEDGLIQGRINAAIERETSTRIAARQAQELVEAVAGVVLASTA